MMKSAKSLSVFRAANKRLMVMMTVAAPYSSGTTERHLRGKPKPNKDFTVAAAAKAKGTTAATTITTVGLGDPCLDLYFGVQKDAPKSQKYRLLKRLLPVAWSHNPLTTLKLISNLIDFPSASDLAKDDSESFYRAAVWLHHNHPKTLASNAVAMAGKFTKSVGFVDDLAQILHRLTKSKTRISESEDYRVLHERVSGMFADYLRANIQNMNKQEPLSHYDCFPPAIGSAADRATLLCESIAKKVFPRSSYPEYQGLEESLYLDAVRDRLRDEVLAPLNHFAMTPAAFASKSSPVIKYLEEVKAIGVIEPGALLPHEIIRCANDKKDRDYTDVAQLQWEKMVEDVYLRQGKLRNCLVVCNAAASPPGYLHNHVSLSLAILVSQLSGGPWKGKVMNFSPNPELHNLPSDLDLVSKCAFLRSMDCGPSLDIPKVFDLILQAAASANLRPDQMIKKVFLVTASEDFDDQALCPRSCKWEESDYQAILTKYKEKGYDQGAVPQIVFWKLNTYGTVIVPRTRPGLATFSGFSNNLFKSFLDNDGQVGPRHVMEAAISEPRYQNLFVVD